MTYEELDGKVAVTKSSIFATKFKIEKLQAELLQLESQLKKLREAKWLKICDDVKPTLLDGNFDIALDDLQAFLQAKKNVGDKIPKPKRKSFAKKMRSDFCGNQGH